MGLGTWLVDATPCLLATHRRNLNPNFEEHSDRECQYQQQYICEQRFAYLGRSVALKAGSGAMISVSQAGSGFNARNGSFLWRDAKPCWQ